jgi:hypothetical protein
MTRGRPPGTPLPFCPTLHCWLHMFFKEGETPWDLHFCPTSSLPASVWFLMLSSTERRFATRFYDAIRSYRLVEHPPPQFQALRCLVSGSLQPRRPIFCCWSPPLRRHIIGIERWPRLPKKNQWIEMYPDSPVSFSAS